MQGVGALRAPPQAATGAAPGGQPGQGQGQGSGLGTAGRGLWSRERRAVKGPKAGPALDDDDEVGRDGGPWRHGGTLGRAREPPGDMLEAPPCHRVPGCHGGVGHNAWRGSGDGGCSCMCCAGGQGGRQGPALLGAVRRHVVIVGQGGPGRPRAAAPTPQGSVGATEAARHVHPSSSDHVLQRLPYFGGRKASNWHALGSLLATAPTAHAPHPYRSATNSRTRTCAPACSCAPPRRRSWSGCPTTRWWSGCRRCRTACSKPTSWPSSWTWRGGWGESKCWVRVHSGPAGDGMEGGGCLQRRATR